MKEKTKIIILLLIIINIILGCILNINKVFAATVTGSQSIVDGVYVIKSAINNNYVLDISHASKDNKANLQLYQYSNVNQQKFNVKYLGNGYYTISVLHSEKVLDVANAGTTNGTNVWQYAQNNSDAQKWIIKSVGNGYYSIISKCNGLYMDVKSGNATNGSNIQMYTGNGTNAQKFIFESIKNTGEKTVNDGVYTIKSASDKNYVLDISNASVEDKANLQIYKNEKKDSQKFEVKYLNNGYYTITVLHSGKVLDVDNAGTTNGTNVWQYKKNDTDAQKWVIKSDSNGYYSIISKCNGLYMDVKSGIIANGTNIQMYTGNGTNAQKFLFEEVSTSNNQNNTVQSTSNQSSGEEKPEKTVENGTYSIATAISSNFVLDIQGGLKTDKANVQIYKKQSANRQKFKVEYGSDGYYTITAIYSGKVLDVANAQMTSGANVWQYKRNNTDAQKWIIQTAGNGYYYIISKLNGLYLDVSTGSVKNGQNIQVYNGNKTNAQKFKFVTPLNVLNSIDTSKYPGYKEKISKLMDTYPGWNFELLYTNIKFDTAVSGEVKLHSRNLVPNTYSGEWICTTCGTKLYDSGWYCASEKATAYYLDSRNFLDAINIFQFQDLNEYINGVCSLEGIKSQINGTFLQNYATDIDTACKNQNVNSYYIITRIIQEQGRSGTTIGKGMNGGDGKTYYNPFNIGASGNGWDTIYANALATAKKNGWDSMEKALEGGIKYCKTNWLENHQNTLYQNKFDIDSTNGTALYEHQYMQNLMGAYSEARIMNEMYSNTNKLESNFTFIIPLYENMSTTIASLPSNNSELSPINVKVTANGGLNLRSGASTSASTIKTINQGEVLLSVQRGINSNWQKIVLTDGTIGYMSGTYLKQVNDVTNCNYTAKVKTSDGSGCNVRVGPSTKLDKITSLSDGTTVTVINKGTYNNIDGYNWCRIQLTDGRQAFMPLKFLQ